MHQNNNNTGLPDIQDQSCTHMLIVLVTDGVYYFTYSENSPTIQAAAYNTSHIPFFCTLPVNK